MRQTAIPKVDYNTLYETFNEKKMDFLWLHNLRPVYVDEELNAAYYEPTNQLHCLLEEFDQQWAYINKKYIYRK